MKPFIWYFQYPTKMYAYRGEYYLYMWDIADGQISMYTWWNQNLPWKTKVMRYWLCHYICQHLGICKLNFLQKFLKCGRVIVHWKKDEGIEYLLARIFIFDVFNQDKSSLSSHLNGTRVYVTDQNYFPLCFLSKWSEFQLNLADKDDEECKKVFVVCGVMCLKGVVFY